MVKGPSRKHSRHSKPSRAKKKIRTVTIAFYSKTGERKMSSLTAVAGGFDVGKAHRMVGNLTLYSPGMPAGNTCTFKVTFDPGTAVPPKAMSGSLIRDLPGGVTQQNVIGVSAVTAMDVAIPLGVFSGRQVSYKVADSAVTGLRTLTLRIRSLDGYGLNEVWHLDLTILVGAADTADFQLRAGPSMTIDSVDVTP